MQRSRTGSHKTMAYSDGFGGLDTVIRGYGVLQQLSVYSVLQCGQWLTIIRKAYAIRRLPLALRDQAVEKPFIVRAN